jgi:N-acetylglucosamine kinase-like BadF-type ATPase
MLRDELGLARDLDVCALVAPGQALGGRDRIAALCPIVARAADAGDAGALEIFAQAGGELADVAEALRTALDYPADETAPLSFSGGVFTSGGVLKRAFGQAVSARAAGFSLTAPKLSPLAGAALLAARHAGAPLDAQAVERLRDHDH